MVKHELQGNIEALRGSENYGKWRSAMRGLLRTLDLDEYIDPKSRSMEPRVKREPEMVDDDDVESEDCQIKDAQVSLVIVQSVSKDIQKNTMRRISALDKWDYLQRRFAGAPFAESCRTLTDFFELKIKDCKDVRDFVGEFATLAKKVDGLNAGRTLVSTGAKAILFLSKMDQDIMFKSWVRQKRSEFRMLDDPDEINLHDLFDDAIQEAQSLESAHRTDSAMSGRVRRGIEPPCATCGRDNHVKRDCYYNRPWTASDRWRPCARIGKFKYADPSMVEDLEMYKPMR